MVKRFKGLVRAIILFWFVKNKKIKGIAIWPLLVNEVRCENTCFETTGPALVRDNFDFGLLPAHFWPFRSPEMKNHLSIPNLTGITKKKRYFLFTFSLTFTFREYSRRYVNHMMVAMKAWKDRYLRVLHPEGAFHTKRMQAEKCCALHNQECELLTWYIVFVNALSKQKEVIPRPRKWM